MAIYFSYIKMMKYWKALKLKGSVQLGPSSYKLNYASWERNVKMPIPFGSKKVLIQSYVMSVRGTAKVLNRLYSKTGMPVLAVHIQWTLVTTTFIPKDVVIKMNLLLYRILKEQIDMLRNVLFCSYFLTEHMFWIFVKIASLRRF